MAPGTKSKVSSSFFDLKAEIAKQEEAFAKNQATGKSKLIIGGVKRPDKKPTVWARQNKGVGSRASRDIELEEISKPTLEAARAALERKAKIYEKLKGGKTGGLSERQYDALLVDFDLKAAEDTYGSDSDDVDESLVVPTAPINEEDDPIVEYEDEFGRMRTGRRSEIPRHLLQSDQNDEEEDIVIRNPVNHFPVYEPTAERVAQITEEYSEANNPLNVHYDATREVRAKGAGFYAFSADDETRKQQMEELKAARVETEEVRQETGALNVKPGEVEGMRDQSTLRSRAMEKRKREIEERRRILDAKRRKVNQREASSTATPSDVDAGGSMATKIAPQPSSGPFAELEAVSTIKLRVAPSSEGDRGTEHKKSETQKGMDKAGPHDIANAFLAELERDIFGKNPDK